MGEEIIRILDLKAESSKYMPTTGSVLSQLKPVHCHTFYFHFNANLYSTYQSLHNDNNHDYINDKITSASRIIYYEFRSKCRGFFNAYQCAINISSFDSIAVYSIRGCLKFVTVEDEMTLLMQQLTATQPKPCATAL